MGIIATSYTIVWLVECWQILTADARAQFLHHITTDIMLPVLELYTELV